jgi:hypothetical protein
MLERLVRQYSQCLYAIPFIIFPLLILYRTVPTYTSISSASSDRVEQDAGVIHAAPEKPNVQTIAEESLHRFPPVREVRSYVVLRLLTCFVLASTNLPRASCFPSRVGKYLPKPQCVEVRGID